MYAGPRRPRVAPAEDLRSLGSFQTTSKCRTAYFVRLRPRPGRLQPVCGPEQTILHAGFGMKPGNHESQKRHIRATDAVQYTERMCRPSPEAIVGTSRTGIIVKCDLSRIPMAGRTLDGENGHSGYRKRVRGFRVSRRRRARGQAAPGLCAQSGAGRAHALAGRGGQGAGSDAAKVSALRHYKLAGFSCPIA